MNKVILCGNVCKDLDPKTLPSGQTVLSFSLATNESYKDKAGNKVDKAEFHNCLAFGKTADIISKYSGKGKKLLVEGKIQTRNYENKEGVKIYKTEVLVSNIELLGQKTEGYQKKEDDEMPVIQADDDEINIEDIPY